MRPVSRHAVPTLLAFGLLAGLSTAGDAQARQRAPRAATRSITLDDVARAMGGQDRIANVRTLVLEGRGEAYNLGQAVTPDAQLPVFTVTNVRRVYDFPDRRWQQDLQRTPRFPSNNPAPQRNRIALDGGVAFNILPDGSAQRVGTTAFLERVNELLYHPIGLLQRAIVAEAQVVTIATPQGPLFRINTGNNEVDLFVDPATALPSMVLKYVHHPMLGDVLLETEFDQWTEVDGIRLPMRFIQRIDGRWPLSDIRFTTARLNTDVGDLSAPLPVRATEPPTPTVNVTVDTVAAGVWRLAGQSHHSIVIEMADHSLLVEAPQSEARTLAVIAKARELSPQKPLRAVINTHHHFDHAGGLRAAMSEGLAIITHRGNAAFVRDLGQRRHHITDDALSRQHPPRPPAIEPVATKRTITDSTRTVEIHHIRGNRHASTMLMVYLPEERLLIEADAYNPPAPNVTNPPPAVFAPNLVENIDRLGLQVERIVPIHGPVIPIDYLRDAARAAAGRLP